MDIKEIELSKIKPYEKNPRKNAEAVKYVANSIKSFGFKVPIVIDSDGVIVAGHTRYKAAKKLGLKVAPCIVADDLSPEEIKAFRLADNKVAEQAEWDFELLDEELADLLDFDMSQFGFDLTVDDMEETEIQEDEDDLEPPADPITKPGDVWKLGRHRFMCGDSTSVTDVEKLLQGKKADLVFTDPPYGMKKESDGVANDNLNYDDLLDFNRQWIPISFDNLKENGSWYCWGIDEPLMDIYSNILRPMQKANQITFRNLITWKKENDNPTMLFNGACSASNRKFYTNEKCLFAMAGVQGFNNNADHYDETFEPIRSYMEQEAKKVGLTPKKLTEICGVQMYGHWFTKSQFGIIPKEHYQKLQKEYKGKAFQMDHEDLRLLFDSEAHQTLKEAVMAKRAYFDGEATQYIDVWVEDVTSGAEKKAAGGHATPKPQAICARGIKSSSREGETVLDLFGGSGSTLIACEQLNRSACLMELEPGWCDVIIARWEKLTGEKAELLEE